MATRRVHAYPAEKEGEVLRRVELWSDRSWTTNPVNGYYVIRVGVARGSYADFVGEWDQRSVSLGAGTPIRLTGNTDINFPLQPEDVCVVEVEVNGEPPKIDGLSIIFRVLQIGSVGRESGTKQNTNYPGPLEVTRPLFESPILADREVQGGVSRLVDQMNESGITEKVISFPIPDLFQSLAREIRWNWTETLVTTAIGSGVWTPMLQVDVQRLDPARRYRVMATGFLNVAQDDATTDVRIRIGHSFDGSTFGLISQSAPVTGLWEVMGTSAQFSFFGRPAVDVKLYAIGVSSTAVAREGSLSIQVADMIEEN
jgi:hypothetical protein